MADRCLPAGCQAGTRSGSVKRIIDIGCGRAGKLAAFAGEFEIIGYDYGDNIAYCQQTYPNGQWHVADLETQIVDAYFTGSVVICADVIEHLVKPDALIETLRNAV
jgi:2-polyprenyl-3-methyl-5-hydroxy-6-metoxy-1,4-benzoquinol methylase